MLLGEYGLSLVLRNGLTISNEDISDLYHFLEKISKISKQTKSLSLHLHPLSTSLQKKDLLNTNSFKVILDPLCGSKRHVNQTISLFNRE